MTQQKLYRPCVGITLFNNDGLVFVGERIDAPGSWQMPQGGIDPGEDIDVAAFRELEEETGISSDHAEIIARAENSISYDLPQVLSGNLWRGKYHGQEQFWMAMRFTGSEDVINLNAHDPAEFISWKWVPIQETIDLVVPFKSHVYQYVIDSFKDIV